MHVGSVCDYHSGGSCPMYTCTYVGICVYTCLLMYKYNYYNLLYLQGIYIWYNYSCCMVMYMYIRVMTKISEFLIKTS